MTPQRFEEIKKLVEELSAVNPQGSPIKLENHLNLLRAAGELVDEVGDLTGLKDPSGENKACHYE